MSKSSHYAGTRVRRTTTTTSCSSRNSAKRKNNSQSAPSKHNISAFYAFYFVYREYMYCTLGPNCRVNRRNEAEIASRQSTAPSLRSAGAARGTVESRSQYNMERDLSAERHIVSRRIPVKSTSPPSSIALASESSVILRPSSRFSVCLIRFTYTHRETSFTSFEYVPTPFNKIKCMAPRPAGEDQAGYT